MHNPRDPGDRLMDAAALQDIQRRLAALESRKPAYRGGQVISVEPLSVALGGSDVAYENVSQLVTPIALETGACVATVVTGNDVLVLGEVGDAPDPPEPPTSIPTGGVIMWPGAGEPDGWLLCTGGTYDVADFPDLAAFLGAGGSTFTTPNFMDRSPFGANGVDIGVYDVGGAKTHTLAGSEMPVHSHNISDTSGFVVDVRDEPSTAGGVGHYVRGTSTPVLITQNSGGGGAHNNLHPIFGINFLIKT